MKRGKIIVIEGTDCSGKETQSKLLCERLNAQGISTKLLSFPKYGSATGNIVGGPYLGKPEISESYFTEGPGSVDPKIASLYYAADRRDALQKIQEILDSGVNLVLDRYTTANMGHQGGKIRDPEKRKQFYEWIHALEYDLLELPIPDLTIFLFMPFSVGMKLKEGRVGEADGHEKDPDHLKDAEEAYLQLKEMYSWEQIDCEDFVNLENPEEGIRGVGEKVLEVALLFFQKELNNEGSLV